MRSSWFLPLFLSSFSAFAGPRFVAPRGVLLQQWEPTLRSLGFNVGEPNGAFYWMMNGPKGGRFLMAGTEEQPVSTGCSALLAKGEATPPFEKAFFLPGGKNDFEDAMLWLMVREDQRLRFADKVAEAKERDLLNLPYAKKIFYETGFPLISTRGLAANRMAWILVQHADGDVQFQQQVLTFLLAQLARGDTHPSDVAYLVDRVWVNLARKAGRKPVQLFGTQGFLDEKGCWQPETILDRASVNERRKAHGLGTLEESIARMNQGEPNCT